MEYRKSVRSALRPRTLFASAYPVLMVVSLVHKSHSISLIQLDVLTVLGCAIVTQLLWNLNTIYSNFQRTLQPKNSGTTDAKIVLNLLSLTQVRRWSYLFLSFQLMLIGLTHIICAKESKVTGCIIALVILAFICCRRGDMPLPIVGLREAVIAWAAGPVSMLSTSYYLVTEVPWSVVLYAYIVMHFTWAFLLLKSATDAPFARRMGQPDTSLALRLGFKLTFQGFLLTMVLFYGIISVTGLAFGHLGNFFLLATIVKLKDISEDFRLERLHHLPDQLAKLAVVLGAGLIISILTGLA
ncbi:-dihydroxy-2-naphthoate octaprenyltransferase [Plasmopara halstedii]|uniref:-dihydroxy-2-naphthoate octaprenyltransferase n=1 Tax=Plasmopara halstedii TaxID=4781 RepID=A0A0P1AYF6_PLAHL|nr:-dihydroxy-2-naphthoate octaprenyltransferase [Plasmopara halstedii]CEG45780.1 -dihydroxy-2-naphthoate octaprenyltransferase [Plasmopara halstedii]|eukprot:XP_024582149.1 -dihydroxy-2-naphthoate octaprenyltransferase [Plasmopara halstedii]